MAHRFSGTDDNGKPRPYHGLVTLGTKGPRWNGKVRLLHEKLREPMKVRKPTLWFVDSMSDLFHEEIPFEFIAAVFGVMAACPRHTFQVLTKRPERAAQFMEWVRAQRGQTPRSVCSQAAAPHVEQLWHFSIGDQWPLDNVLLGTSVEDQQTLNERVPALLRAEAARYFVSAEPLLEGVDFTCVPANLGGKDGRAHAHDYFNALTGTGLLDTQDEDQFEPGVFPSLDWVIVGGESGDDARGFFVEWARDAIGQCRGAGVAVFIKQLGSNAKYLDHEDSTVRRLELRDSKGGEMHEWPDDVQVREMPEAA